jgi:hypothetical protein
MLTKPARFRSIFDRPGYSGREYYCTARGFSPYLSKEILERQPLTAPTQAEIDEESRMIRRLRILVQLTVETIAEGGLSPEEASGMIAATRRIALEMFPGKERAFDILYRPQFQRVMHAIYRLQ